MLLVIGFPSVIAFSPRSLAGHRLAVRQQANPIEEFILGTSNALKDLANKLDFQGAAPAKVKRSEYDAEIESANELLLRAVATKDEDGGEVTLFRESIRGCFPCACAANCVCSIKTN